MDCVRSGASIQDNDQGEILLVNIDQLKSAFYRRDEIGLNFKGEPHNEDISLVFTQENMGEYNRIKQIIEDYTNG